MKKTLVSAAIVAALALPTAAFAQDQPQGSSNAIITNDAATMPIAAPADTDQMTDQPQGASNSVITNEAALGTTTFPADVDSAQVEVRPAWGNSELSYDQQVAANTFWASHPELTVTQ